MIIDGTDTTTGVVGKINNFFTQTRPNADAGTQSNDDEVTDSPGAGTPSYCGTENPARQYYYPSR